MNYTNYNLSFGFGELKKLCKAIFTSLCATFSF
jgi:hypothetical protein